MHVTFKTHTVGVCTPSHRRRQAVSNWKSDGLNAAGPWSSEFNKLAGVGAEFTVSVRPMRQEVHQVPAPDGFNPAGGFGPAIADMDLGVYARPAPHGVLYIGGTEPECDPLEWIDDPDVFIPERYTEEGAPDPLEVGFGFGRR